MIRQLIFTTIVSLVSTSFSFAAVKTEVIKYKVGVQEFIGHLAWDDAQAGARPGVLLFHEWWGLDDYAKGRAKQLAELGYVAFAADMYGAGKTVDHPKDAGEMAGSVRANAKNWLERATAAFDVLKKQPQCDPSRMAAIGYCFGGSTALQLAYSGAELKSVVTFHAALPTPNADQAKQIKARITVCHGADDGFIPAAAIANFQAALKMANVRLDFHTYAGARHSFTVPSADKHGIDGLKYNKEADEKSWADMLAAFQNTLQVKN